MAFLGFITISAAAAAASTVPPVAPPPAPPPPVLIASPPPPNRYANRIDQPTTTLRIEALAGKAVLWSGQLRVGNAVSDFTQAMREPLEACPGQPGIVSRYDGNSTFRQIRIGAARWATKEEPDRFQITANWVRPAEGCKGGSSTVAFDRAVTIPAGGTAEVVGDGGLVLKLTRGA